MLEKTICIRVVASMSVAAESLHTALGGIARFVFWYSNTRTHCILTSHYCYYLTTGSHKETRSKNREYLYLASSELEQALKASQKKKQKSTEPPPAKKPAAKTKKNKNVVPVTKNEAEPVTNGVPTSTPVVATDTHEDASKNNKKKKSKKQANIESDDTKVLESPPTERRKSVRFSLKKNLVRRIGEPPFPEDVRTPPTSKPKGSALKRTSGLAVDSRKKSLTFDSETKNGDGSKAHQKKNKKRKKHL